MTLWEFRGGVHPPTFYARKTEATPSSSDIAELVARRASPAAKRRAVADAIGRADVAYNSHPFRPPLVAVYESVLDEIRSVDELENPLPSYGRREVAGLLLENPHKPGLVAHAIGAYRDAQPNSVTLDGGLAEPVYLRHRIIGDWQTHPNGDRRPSDPDLVAWARGCADLGTDYLGMIASFDEMGSVSLSAYVARVRRASSGPAWAIERADVEVLP